MLDTARLDAAYRGSLYQRPPPAPPVVAVLAPVVLAPPAVLEAPAWAVELREQRERMGLNKTEVAEYADVGRATVYACERGLGYVTKRTRRRLRAALDELEAWANG